MIFADKKVGETPLEFLNRLRGENPELRDEKLSYAGRLDPMAEGQMLVIVGEENKLRENFLGFDKEYLATFLVGVKTDSGDILGIVTSAENLGENSASENFSTEDTEEKIREQVKNLTKITKQKYPWFSGATVGGIKLFDHFKNGNFDIERPTRKVEIKNAEFVSATVKSADEINKYIFESISKVNGDFRQEKIVACWRDFFANSSEFIAPADGISISGQLRENFLIFEVRFLVSTGTYIRALTEEFDFPVTLLKLKRTKILVKN